MHQVYLVDGMPNINLKDIRLERKLLADIAQVKSVNVHTEQELPEEFFASDAIISWHFLQLSDKTFRKLKNCKGIVRTGVGYDNLDIKAAGTRGIAIFNIPDYCTHEVADHTMALVLALTRRLKIYDSYVMSGAWNWETAKPIRRLSTLTLGLIGCGRIGRQVFERAKAFRFKLTFFDPYLPAGIETTLGVSRSESLADLLKESDIVSLHVPLTNETKGMINKHTIQLMKPGSILINTARGGVMETEAILKAVESSRVSGVGLDVIEGEPKLPSKLLDNPKIMISPHAAFYSEESLIDLRRKSAELVRAILLKALMPEPVNKEFLDGAK